MNRGLVTTFFTRSRAGRIRGYVDAQQVFDFTDTTAAKINSLNTLRFFRDNDNREETSGAVSRIRLYDNGMTPARMALAFCYTKWQVASTIIGVTSMAQLDEDLDAWGTTLSPELLAKIDQIRWEIRDPAV